MSYHIKKEVKFGPKYVEHIYGSHPEIWSGTWMKVLLSLLACSNLLTFQVGHDVNNSPTSFNYLCQFCQRNSRSRTQIGIFFFY